MATETHRNEVDDVPLLGTDNMPEPHRPQQQQQAVGAPPRSTSPTMPASVTYPAHPPTQGGGLPPPQPYPPISGGGTSFPAQTQYNPNLAPVNQQQQSSNTNIVVTSPPSSLPNAPNPQPVPPANPTLMVITIVAALILFFFGLLPTWFCIFPAVIFAIVGYSLGDSPREDQRQTAKLMNGFALGCNIGALVTFVLMVVIMIICIIIFATNVHRR